MEAVTNFFTEHIGMSYAVVYLLFFVLAYLALKIIMTVFVCKDKIHSVHLKVLKSKSMPICTCKEALKVWQTVLIYLVPIVLMYFVMLVLYLGSERNPVYIVTFLFLSYYMAFDLTLVFYVLFYKIKNRMAYVSVDLHVYQMTTFSNICSEPKQAEKKPNIINPVDFMI